MVKLWHRGWDCLLESYPALVILPQTRSPVAVLPSSLLYVTRKPAQESGELGVLGAELPVEGARAQGTCSHILFGGGGQL